MGLRFFLKTLLIRSNLELCTLRPSYFAVKVMRNSNQIQLSLDQLKLIIDTIMNKTPTNLLVFGLGNDSIFWNKLNRKGTTVFLEDNKL
jgi:hypothetical protein